MCFELWHNDKAECHHFIVLEREKEREIGREMADCVSPGIHDTRNVPCSPTHVLNSWSSGSSISIFSINLI